jgi:hypothetical protein
MKLQEALLSIRHWESSCRWLASGLQDCGSTSPFSGIKEATIAHSEKEIEDQEESGQVKALFEMLETRNHPLSMTLRSCFSDIKRHLFSNRKHVCCSKYYRKCDWVGVHTYNSELWP